MAKPMPASVVTACEPCRSRKVKCDKVHPRCRSCVKHGLDCVFLHERVKKGPRKGELGRLKAQVASLEQKLALQQAAHQPTSAIGVRAARGEVDAIPTSMSECIMPQRSQIEFEESRQNESFNELDSGIYSGGSNHLAWETRADPEFMAWLDLTLSSPELSLPIDDTSQIASSWDTMRSGLDLDRLAKADLEATYFDRAHPFMPLLNRNYFHSWSNLETVTPAQECLRSAVWTVAAALCPRFHDLYESLYRYTKQLLQYLDGGDHVHLWTPVGTPQLEKVQAWILMGHCDFIRHNSHSTILTVTRVSRLVQAGQFNLQHTRGGSSDDKDPLTIERATSTQQECLEDEKGRAFWIAFCFDRMVHTLDHSHLTLPDESAYRPLPCPESSYQGLEGSSTCTLAEALEGPFVDLSSHFAESIVATALYGRCLTHRRLVAAARNRERPMVSPSSETGSEIGTEDCQRRYAWLSQALELRVQSNNESPTTNPSPLLVLTHILNLGCCVHLIETLVEHIDRPEGHRHKVHHAYDAVRSIASCAATLPQAECFKTHPLVPVILSQALNFVKTYKYIIEQDWEPASIDQVLQCLVLQLRKFEDVHFIAKEFLEKHTLDD